MIEHQSRKKAKHEKFYDDPKATIMRRGDVLRESEFHFPDLDYPIHEFMYKMLNVKNDKPYVEKMEMRAKVSLDEFLQLLGENIPKNVKPVLFASQQREYVCVSKDGYRFVITLDRTTYTRRKMSCDEVMLEIEGIDDNEREDKQYFTMHDLMMKSGFPLELTKASKFERGMIAILPTNFSDGKPLEIKCPICNNPENQIKKGRTSSGTQRMFCKSCQCKYTPRPKGWGVEAKEQAVKAFLSGESAAQIARRLGMDAKTVIQWTKDSSSWGH